MLVKVKTLRKGLEYFRCDVRRALFYVLHFRIAVEADNHFFDTFLG